MKTIEREEVFQKFLRFWQVELWPKIYFFFVGREKVFLLSTDTLVALAAPATKKGAKTLSFLKRRSVKKPLAIGFVLERARRHFAWTNDCEDALVMFGDKAPLTLISKGVGFRIIDPKCAKLKNFIKKSRPLYLTSANFEGQRPLSFAEAKKVFGKFISESFDFCKPSGIASRVVRVDTKTLLR